MRHPKIPVERDPVTGETTEYLDLCLRSVLEGIDLTDLTTLDAVIDLLHTLEAPHTTDEGRARNSACMDAVVAAMETSSVKSPQVTSPVVAVSFHLMLIRGALGQIFNAGDDFNARMCQILAVPGLADVCDSWRQRHNIGDAPRCIGCHKLPAEISEYVDAAREGEYPEEYVRREEGTFNPARNLFWCTECYIAAGSPTGRAGVDPGAHECACSHGAGYCDLCGMRMDAIH